jgi:hypothetical protein
VLEIYLLEGTEEVSLKLFLEKLAKMELNYVVRKAPTKHERILSCYVEAAFKQAGIWGMPLPRGHLRMLVASETVTPLAGQSMGKLMFASHPDADTLCTVALHELGHSLKAVRRKSHKLVMQVKSKREVMNDTKTTLIQQGALEKLSKLYPDSMVELDGAHCLGMGCIMQVVPKASAITQPDSFCDLCAENLKDSVSKINKEFDETPSYCGDCINLRSCMYTKENVYEKSDICAEFEQDPEQAEKAAKAEAKRLALIQEA